MASYYLEISTQLEEQLIARQLLIEPSHGVGWVELDPEADNDVVSVVAVVGRPRGGLLQLFARVFPEVQPLALLGLVHEAQSEVVLLNEADVVADAVKQLLTVLVFGVCLQDFRARDN